MRVAAFLLLTVLSVVLGKLGEPVEKQQWLVKEKRPSTTRPFNTGIEVSHLGRAASTAEMTFTIALVQKNMDVIEKTLKEVSTPGSAKYGQHLTFDQVGELVRNDEATAAVQDWLREHKAEVVSSTPHGEYLVVRARVSSVETMLNTQMHEYKLTKKSSSKESDKRIFRADSYSLPIHLAPHVLAVRDVTHFPEDVNGIVPKRRVFPTPLGTGGNLAINTYSKTTPAGLEGTYGIGAQKGSNNVKQVVGGLNTGGDNVGPTDLQTFENVFTMPVDQIAGWYGKPPNENNCTYSISIGQDWCAENNLDMQYMTSTGKNIPTYYYYSGNETQVGPYSDIFMFMANQITNKPDVISFSYGAFEPVSSDFVSFDTEAAKLGLQGVTIFASSGDNGVSGNVAPFLSQVSLCGVYFPSFAATSQYVVAVGATMGGLDFDFNNEIACSNDQGALITSGGGFSTVETVTAYDQTAGVSAYFDNVFIKPVAFSDASFGISSYDPAYRGFPDLAFNGHNYAVFDAGILIVADGTSASSPGLTGMVNTINSALVAAGKSSVGYLNPTIWSSACHWTRDVTWGSNFCSEQQCCAGSDGSSAGSQGAGFWAARGWDPVTGKR